LFVVTQREFDGIADVAEAAFLRDAELHASRDFAVMNIEAGNDTFSHHWGY
jgi:hypothetical protein